MIDNINQIKKLLEFKSDDEFYFLQILKRSKENSDLGSNNFVVKTYYIDSIEKFDREYEEIKTLCQFHNARAYINLNKRSFKQIAFQTLKVVTDSILNKEYKYIKKAYNTACGRFTCEEGDSRKWIIDIDSKESYFRFAIAEKIRRMEPNPGESKVITYIETKNGWHIITKPFNQSKFRLECEICNVTVDIHKNNPTVLYVPDTFNKFNDK